MRKILIYSGTTEGRNLAALLANANLPADVSVATEYGRQVMEESKLVHVLEGRMTESDMRALYEKEDYLAVVDATHPFATVVTDTIRKSLVGYDIPYLRLARGVEFTNEGGAISSVASVEEAVEQLKKMDGRILLTTGSKDLASFCKDEALRERLVVRVLPGLESIKLCYDQGLEGKQIIAMQGPFSKEMNLAQIREYQLSAMVTKESGTTGGVDQKLMACEEAGIPCIMIHKPSYDAVEELDMQQVCDRLGQLTGEVITPLSDIAISLIGIGPGSESLLTQEAKNAIHEADVLFGAKRMIDSIAHSGMSYPYYLAKDIIPVLREQKLTGRHMKAAVLFSGDTGFYSGCEKLKDALQVEGFKTVRVIPGISSVVYMASKLGLSYQDGEFLSTHGIAQETWKNRLLMAVAEKERVLLLTSGKEDVAKVYETLHKTEGWDGVVIAGYQLSYADEEIFTVCDTSELKDGLYVLAVLSNKRPERIVAPYLRDEDFIRDQVPMTKEEIRHLSVCKLKLTQDAVIYDIGSGTGSIAIEMARMLPGGQIYAIEVNDTAVELIHKNVEKFQVPNVSVIAAKAPEGFMILPPPTHAFIGGSKGNLREILQSLYEKNHRMRVVMNAVSLESVCQMQQLLTEFPVEDVDITQVSVTKTRELGNYHMLTSNNPVFIFAFSFTEEQ